jgi:2,3-bisphosphoglycerate-independent phosphoglycerate mutase
MVALIILDGWGHRLETQHNAIAQAKTPFFDRMWKEWPHSLLTAGGEAVGLPEGQVGNSEIGHSTIGAGTVIDTDLVQIAKAIRSGAFATNPAFEELFDHVRLHDSTLHVIGLLSPGGVHSHQEHLYEFLRLAKQKGITKLAIHAITDGRDTSPRSAASYLKELEDVLSEVGIGRIATVSGRYYAMDRDKNWDRLAKYERALFEGDGHRENVMPSQLVSQRYAEAHVDEHLEPIVFLDADGASYPIQTGDGVFFFNFRPDRARMLAQKLHERTSTHDLAVVTMAQYEKNLPLTAAFPPRSIETTLAEQISLAGLRQVHIAETEKFPHATYFLNGGREEPHPGEEHIMLESRKDIATHDQAPQMRAEGIADETLRFVASDTDFIFINFANPDMVGHTGNVPAIIEALETTDRQVCRVVEAILARGGIAIVTADHGNAEVNVDLATGEKHTAHTLNPVPCIGVGLAKPLRDGSLADLAPTVLTLLNVPVPRVMTGRDLSYPHF